MGPPLCRENASRVIDLLSRTYPVWLTRSMLAPPWSPTGSILTGLSVINEQCEYPGWVCGSEAIAGAVMVKFKAELVSFVF